MPVTDQDYHIVDCGDRGCETCPAAYRDESEPTAIEQAKAHKMKGETTVTVVSTD